MVSSLPPLPCLVILTADRSISLTSLCFILFELILGWRTVSTLAMSASTESCGVQHGFFISLPTLTCIQGYHLSPVFRDFVLSLMLFLDRPPLHSQHVQICSFGTIVMMCKGNSDCRLSSESVVLMLGWPQQLPQASSHSLPVPWCYDFSVNVAVRIRWGGFLFLEAAMISGSF